MIVIDDSETHILFKNDAGTVILKEKTSGREYRCRWDGTGYDCSGTSTPDVLMKRDVKLRVDLLDGLTVSEADK